jgi:Flp pilus assembly protein TadB
MPHVATVLTIHLISDGYAMRMALGDDTKTRQQPTGRWAYWARSGGDRTQTRVLGPPFWVLAIVFVIIGVVAAIHGSLHYALYGLVGAVVCMLVHFALNALAREGNRRTYGRQR